MVVLRNLVLIIVSFCTVQSYAQDRPKVALPSSYICDTTPYQLVFFDDFNGNSLDTNFWTTYLSWHGIWQDVDGQRIYGDHPFSCGARKNNDNAFYKDENVVVSEGTCKLLIKNEKYTFPCILGAGETAEDCSRNGIACPESTTQYYTTGGIFSRFRFANHPDGTPHTNHFSNGRFEARLRHPVFEGAWTCMWTWYGTRVNEIDITESWGGKPRSFRNLVAYAGGKKSQQLRSNAIVFHAWNYKGNPYGFPENGEDAAKMQYYSGQSWMELLAGKALHNQAEWHTYTCEWDSTMVRVFMDGKLEMEYWKYFKYQDFKAQNLWGAYRIRIPATCDLDSGTYYLSEGFPYEHNSMSQLRLSTSLTQNMTGLPVTNTTLGMMEIEYVKIWQRHPEKDQRKAIPEPKVSAIQDLKNDEAQPMRVVVVQNEIADSLQQILLTVVADNSDLPYEWKIRYGADSQDLKTLNLSGQTVATTMFPKLSDAFFIDWELTVRNENGMVKTMNGSKRANEFTRPRLSEYNCFVSTDSSAFYLQSFMNLEEWSSYEMGVYEAVRSVYFKSSCDATTIATTIQAIRLNNLLPFLYFEDMATLQFVDEHNLVDQ